MEKLLEGFEMKTYWFWEEIEDARFWQEENMYRKYIYISNILDQAEGSRPFQIHRALSFVSTHGM